MQAIEQIDQAQQQAKQNSIIRKAAVQSLQPVITKIEEHVAFLLAETTKLREKNQILQRTVMNHNVINQSVAQLREDLHKLSLNMQESDKKGETQTITLKEQIVGLNLEIQRINMDMKKKDAKLQELFQKNREQGKKMDINSENLKEIVQKYALQVATLQSNGKNIKNQLHQAHQQFKISVQSLTGIIEQKDCRIQQNTQKLELYLTERQEIKKLIGDIWGKVDKAVDIDRYEKDWRIIRMENEAMKKQNKKMIDQALTPDVRKFLPEMMERIAEVRKVNTLEQVIYQQKGKTDKFQQSQLKQIQNLKLLLQSAEEQTKRVREQLKLDHQSIVTEFSMKLQKGSDTASTAIISVQEQTNKLLQQKEAKLTTQIETLLERNRQTIYQIVTSLIPSQEKEFYLKMKQFLPLLESTKKEVLERCDQITLFGKSLEERLEGFNNRIVKIKGDMAFDVDNLKKKNKMIDNSIQIIADNFKSLGKVISSYCELFMVHSALTFDPVDKEVYVTYNDGIVYESCENENEINYRKVKATREQFRKSAMSNLIKLVDSLIADEEYGFMFIGEFKPSSYFKSIRQGVLITPPPNMSGKKKQRKFSAKAREGSLQNKLPSIDINQSKTIQITNKEVETSRQMANTLTSDFSNMRKKQRQRPYRGRYSQMK